MLDVFLRSKGFTVMIASSGEDALEQATRQLPDIVVSDILMPIMDGFTLCRKWKADPTFNAVPFVFYTATYTDPKDEEFALGLGAVRFIKKPVEIDVFLGIILEVLDGVRIGKTGLTIEQDNDDEIYYKKYNETLIRKLENKMLQLENANTVLREEVAERMKMESALRITLEEKETLISELYHRTRNNMQIISSLMSIESTRKPGKKIDSFVADMNSRIQSLAIVHKKLYEAKNLSRISLNEYIRELCDFLKLQGDQTEDAVSFQYNMHETKVPIETAAPLGLVVRELVSNSLRHAFPRGRKGEIAISLNYAGGHVLNFSYSDNGVGLPKRFDYQTDGRMGFELIMLLVKNQLHGKFDFIEGAGFNCQISLTIPR